MSFNLNDLQTHPVPQISRHKCIPWRPVTGKMPLVTKTNFLIGGSIKTGAREGTRAMH
jgi:hypothetical protein